MLTFKSLAEFRRLLKVGMRFECTHHTLPKLSGERVITRAQVKALACRRVAPCPKCKAPLRPCSTGDVACIHCDGCGWCGQDDAVHEFVGETWAYFPDAKLVKITPRTALSGSVIAFCDPAGRVVFEYHSFTEEQSHAACHP